MNEVKAKLSKVMGTVVCFFKKHDYGETRARNYKEINDSITYNEIRTCKRCKHIDSKKKIIKRIK